MSWHGGDEEHRLGKVLGLQHLGTVLGADGHGPAIEDRGCHLAGTNGANSSMLMLALIATTACFAAV